MMNSAPFPGTPLLVNYYCSIWGWEYCYRFVVSRVIQLTSIVLSISFSHPGPLHPPLRRDIQS